MTLLVLAATAVLALAVGVAGGWYVTRTRYAAQVQIAEGRMVEKEARVQQLGEDLMALHERHDKQIHGKDQELNLAQLATRDLDTRLAKAETQLTEERKLWESKLALLNEAREKLGDAFRTLSAEVMRSSNQSFLELAQETLSKFQEKAAGDLSQRQQAVGALVAPIQQSLDQVREQIQLVEKTRAQAYGSLTEHLNQMMGSQDRLRTETGNLVKALRAPQARGRWGEMQLQRVVEMAGMVEHCDFQQQASVNTADGRLRPDMVVRLPGGKNIVVDAKAPLAAYLEALEAGDDAQKANKLVEHAAQVRAHLAKLGSKSYWQQFQPTPEFVVLFLPGEAFFSAALQQDPTLIEEGVKQHVIVATPTTLIALLRAVAYGWRQEAVAEQAQKVATLGNELYERIRVFASHLARVGDGLDSAVDCYNKAVGSLESRVLVSARRFKELGATSGEDLPELPLAHKKTRSVDGLGMNGRAPVAPLLDLPPPASSVAEALSPPVVARHEAEPVAVADLFAPRVEAAALVEPAERETAAVETVPEADFAPLPETPPAAPPAQPTQMAAPPAVAVAPAGDAGDPGPDPLDEATDTPALLAALAQPYRPGETLRRSAQVEKLLRALGRPTPRRPLDPAPDGGAGNSRAEGPPSDVSISVMEEMMVAGRPSRPAEPQQQVREILAAIDADLSLAEAEPERPAFETAATSVEDAHPPSASNPIDVTDPIAAADLALDDPLPPMEDVLAAEVSSSPQGGAIDEILAVMTDATQPAGTDNHSPEPGR